MANSDFSARPLWVPSELYPFEDRYFDSPGGRMHYVDEGKGPVVLLLHGNPTWSFLYRDIIRELLKDHRCIAPDYIGFGLSAKPANYDYTPANHSRNLASLVEHLKLTGVTVVCQDWGGPIGLDWATKNPGKVHGLVAANTWFWPVSGNLLLQAFSGFMGGIVGNLINTRLNFFVRVLIPAGVSRKERLTTAVKRAYDGPFPDSASLAGVAQFPKEIVKSGPFLAELEKRMPALAGKKTALVWGLKDMAFGRELQRWRNQFPDANVIRVPDGNHYIQEDAPDEIVKAVRWVTES